MSNPIFIHVMSNGDIWVSNYVNDVPTGTVVGSWRVLEDAKFQKIGTLSGTVSSSLTQAGAAGRNGKEVT